MKNVVETALNAFEEEKARIKAKNIKYTINLLERFLGIDPKDCIIKDNGDVQVEDLTFSVTNDYKLKLLTYKGKPVRSLLVKSDFTSWVELGKYLSFVKEFIQDDKEVESTDF